MGLDPSWLSPLIHDKSFHFRYLSLFVILLPFYVPHSIDRVLFAHRFSSVVWVPPPTTSSQKVISFFLRSATQPITLAHALHHQEILLPIIMLVIVPKIPNSNLLQAETHLFHYRLQHLHSMMQKAFAMLRQMDHYYFDRLVMSMLRSDFPMYFILYSYYSLMKLFTLYEI